MNKTTKDDLWARLMRCVFILVILFVAVFSGCRSGLFETTTAITTPIATMPPEETSTTSTDSDTVSTDTTPPQETTSSETTSSSVEQTTKDPDETTYPPVTFPTESGYIDPEVPLGITFDDITDNAMAMLIEEKMLSVRPESRSGEKLKSLKNVVVHYVGNPNTSAANNWNYFEHQNNFVSAHFIIGLKGEIIQCMPLDEVAWAVGDLEGNYTSISIECCHPDESGRFNEATYRSLVKLVSWLCNKFDLEREDVLRHYDYTGKLCPRHFAGNSIEWEEFKDDLLIK